MPRHRPKKRREPEPEEQHPLADPQRPIPNLACADRFEYYYYSQQLVEPGWEWARFINTLHQPLPITFRIQPHSALGDECRKSLHEMFAQEPSLPEMTPLPWCDSFAVSISKEKLKVAYEPPLVALQSWIAKWAALGALSRQAIESMVPVALLQVQPHHVVCDLCASPGSKTTQAIEALFAGAESGSTGEQTRGFMVANDASPARCQMLMRRCAALGEMSERLIVSCHPAQSMPRLPDIRSADGGASSGGRYPEGCYDRIICDVPCSGDGTTRKNPSIWHRWSVEYALEMHRLQLQIALRAVSLIKVGGLVAYSTCSLNPLENESVVAELLTRSRGALELVDCSDRLVELNRAPGLSKWIVLDDDMVEHASHADLRKCTHLNKALKRRYLPSMWPPKKPKPLHLGRCLRLLPHLANMGGFFVALIRKVGPLPGPPPRGGPTNSTNGRTAASATAAAGMESAPAPPAADAPLPLVGSLVEVEVEDEGQMSWKVAEVRQHLRGRKFVACVDGDEDDAEALAMGDEGSQWRRIATAAVPALTGARQKTGRLRAVPEEVLAELSEQLGLKTRSVHDALSGQLICASSKAAVVCRVAPDVAAICARRPAVEGDGARPKAQRSLRIVNAGCILARRTRGGTFQPTIEGARALAPFAGKKSRRVKLGASDALLLIDRAGQPSKRRRAVLLSELSAEAAEAARALPIGPCLLLLQPAKKDQPALTVPARRLREPEGLRLLLLYTAGLEFRPAAMLHSARAWLEP